MRLLFLFSICGSKLLFIFCMCIILLKLKPQKMQCWLCSPEYCHMKFLDTQSSRFLKYCLAASWLLRMIWVRECGAIESVSLNPLSSLCFWNVLLSQIFPHTSLVRWVLGKKGFLRLFWLWLKQGVISLWVSFLLQPISCNVVKWLDKLSFSMDKIPCMNVICTCIYLCI